MPRPLALRAGSSLESDARATPDQLNQNLRLPGRFPCASQHPDARSLPCSQRPARVPAGESNGGPGLPPQCSSVTRGQLTNAQGRGPAETPGRLPWAHGRCGTGQQAAAVARCSAASCGKLQVTVTYFSDLLNQTQVFSSHVPSSPAALHVLPLLHAPGKSTSHVCASCPTLL